MYPRFTTPKTLTAQEQGRLLRAVRAQGSRRDRAILSLALGTGLRLRELAGLNVGDVFTEGSAIAWKVRLDPKITKGGAAAWLSSTQVSGANSASTCDGTGRRSPSRRDRPFPVQPRAAPLPSSDPGPIPE